MIKKRNYSKINTVSLLAVILAVSGLTLLAKKHHKQNAAISETIQIPTQQNNQPRVVLWRRVTVKPGDNLQGIFTALGIPKQDLWALLKTKDQRIIKLKPKQNLEFTLNKEHALQELQLLLANNTILCFSKEEQHFKKKIITLAFKTTTTLKTATINTSLGAAAESAHLPAAIYQQLLTIFEGNINFARDIHQGDQFTVLYEEHFTAEKPKIPGKILAAKLSANHKAYHAIYFEYPGHHAGYYNLEGKSIEPRFLSYPIHFKRISSNFNRHRFDPVIHKFQPHVGTDFAAARGTPIYSIGDGRITFIGKSHGYGNAIKVRYDKHYSALYAHMRNFAANLTLHQYVKKGQIIGYVGSTGWATGPHLHFGFYVNGVPQDWMALKRPTTPAIPKKYRQDFMEKAKQIITTLDSDQS